MLDIPFYAVNFEQEFARIVDYFVREYTAGRTPNPCIVCNTWLKFGRLFDYADSVGAEYVATGHYARLIAAEKGESPRPTFGRCPPERPEGCCAQMGTIPFFRPLEGGEIALCRGRDESKDQSYVLFGIERRLLSRLMFPVGEYRKEEIRRMAERLGLRVAAKRDSQEICFVPDQDHARFIRERRGELDTSGEIVTTDGAVVGHHDGFERYTIGQRKGLRLAFGEPRYVVRIEAASRRVVIGTHEELARTELYAAEANWQVEGLGFRVQGSADLPSPACGRGAGGEGGREQIHDALTLALSQGERGPLDALPSPRSPLLSPFRCEVKIRYRSRAAAATVEPLADGRFRVRFDEPCYGVAPGQAAVVYDGDRVLGGGWIESS